MTNQVHCEMTDRQFEDEHLLMTLNLWYIPALFNKIFRGSKVSGAEEPELGNLSKPTALTWFLKFSSKLKLICQWSVILKYMSVILQSTWSTKLNQLYEIASHFCCSYLNKNNFFLFLQRWQLNQAIYTVTRLVFSSSRFWIMVVYT